MLFDGLCLRPALFSLGLDLLLSFAATRIYQSMLSGTKPLDPVVLSGVVATLETSCDQAHTGNNRRGQPAPQRPSRQQLGSNRDFSSALPPEPKPTGQNRLRSL